MIIIFFFIAALRTFLNRTSIRIRIIPIVMIKNVCYYYYLIIHP